VPSKKARSMLAVRPAWAAAHSPGGSALERGLSGTFGFRKASGWMEGQDLNPRGLTGTRLPFNAVNPSRSSHHQSMPSRLRMLTIHFKKGCSRVISTWTNPLPTTPQRTHNQPHTRTFFSLSPQSGLVLSFLFSLFIVQQLSLLSLKRNNE
jgi:hypothetical protein